MRPVRLFLLSLILLASSSPSRSFLLALQGNTARIEIVLRDAATREAVPGVPVTVTLKYPLEPAGPSTTLLTDPRGIAVFSGLTAAPYLIKLGESYRTSGFNDFILLEPGDQKQFEILVNRTANVSVRLVDPDGNPIKDALVRLPSIGYVNGRRALGFGGDVAASHNNDGNGVFRIGPVSSGTYYLRIENPVTDKNDNNGLPNLWYFPGVPDFASATPIVVRGADLLLGEIKLPRQKGFKVAGSIVNSLARTNLLNTGIQDRVLLFTVPADSTVFEEPVLASRVRFSASSNPNESRFQIDGFAPGNYELYAMFLPGLTAIASKTTFTVKDQDIEDLRIVWKDDVEVSALVKADSVNFLQPLVGVRPLEAVPGVLRNPGLLRPSLRRDEQSAEVRLSGLTEGIRYGLAIAGLPADAFIDDIRIGNISILNEGSFVATSSVDNIEIHLAGRGGIVKGVVQNAMGRVAKAAVVLVPDWPRRNSVFYKRTTTDADGSFNLQGVAPGDYQLFAWPKAPPEGAEQDPIFMMPYAGRGATVRVAAGNAVETPLRLIE
jgi:hypothetical protein